jgi:hypothetical protein
VTVHIDDQGLALAHVGFLLEQMKPDCAMTPRGGPAPRPSNSYNKIK